MFKAGISDVELMVFYALYVFNIQSIVFDFVVVKT